MKITFLACNRNAKLFRSDPSYIYRCENLGLELLSLGHQVEFRHFTEYKLTDFSDIVVLHRPKKLWRIALLIHYLKARGMQVWADFDDLVFDTEYAAFSPGVVNALNSLQSTQKNYLLHQKILPLVHGFILSTEPLRAHLHTLLPQAKAIVIPNAIHHAWRTRFDQDLTVPVDFNRPVLSYLPGTRSHDKDFKLIADSLTHFLKKHPQLSLEITGPLSFQWPASVKPQVKQFEKVAFADFYQRFQSTWVNLAPLEDTPFNRCKSALKVLEAGYWNRPTLCSIIPDTVRYQDNGAIFFNNENLNTQLEALLDPAYYAQVTEGLRERVLTLSDIRQSALTFLQAVNTG